MKQSIDEKRERPEWEEDILSSDRFEQAQLVRHHYWTSVAAHSKKTVEYALRICARLKKHGVRINEKDVVRAALLHDIGMTDQKVSRSISFRKAYLHPRKSEQIAKEEFSANEVQCNAIRRHMWPICLIPPRFREGWVVLAADKCCSLWEITHKQCT